MIAQAQRTTRILMKTLGGVVDKYHLWDARRLLELLPPGKSVDVTITSPPYWNLKDYGVKSQLGFGQTYEQYLDDLAKVFKAVHSVTKDAGSLWIITDTVKHEGEIKLLPFDLARRLRDIGWILQDIVIWNKDRTLPWSHQGKLRNIFEYVAFYTKSPKFTYHLSRVREVHELREWWVRYPERYSPQGKAPSRAWFVPIPRQGSWGSNSNWVRHFNPLPPKLVQRILLLATDESDLVLDPFTGSGAVLAQAAVMRRKYIGLDLNRSYKRMFKKQVLPAIRKLYKQDLKESSETARRKRIFHKLIRSLRKTKYPKEVVRLYRRAYGEIRLQAVVALGANNGRFLRIVFLFPRASDVFRYFLKRVDALSKRPPLSKYGIVPAFSAYPLDAVPRAWLRRLGFDPQAPLYLYANGKTHTWSRRLESRELVLAVGGRGESSPKYKYPPIISDIRVKADPRSLFLRAGERS